MRSSRLLFLALLPLMAVAARAQYYNSWYEGKCRLLVVPHDSATGGVISGLRITLVDGADPPFTPTFGAHWTFQHICGEEDGRRFPVYNLFCVDTLRPSTPYLLVEDIDSCGANYQTMTFPLADTSFLLLSGLAPSLNLNRARQPVIDSLMYVHVTVARRPVEPRREMRGVIGSAAVEAVPAATASAEGALR